MDMITSDIVERTWKEIATLSPRRMPRLVRRMGREQPLVLAYLMAVDNDILNQDERELLLYLGVVVWQITSQGSQPLPKVTEDILDEAEARNTKMAEYLQGETEVGFEEATRTIIRNYGQPEVLRCVVEALIEEPEERCLIRDENRGIMLLDLKTVIDCLDS